MKRRSLLRSLFFAAPVAVLMGLLSSCGLPAGNPAYHDKTAPQNITTVMTTSAPPACHLLGNDKQQQALIAVWPKLDRVRIESAQPALSSNPEHYAPQYRCVYGQNVETNEQEMAFAIATAAEKPGSHKLFDYTVNYWKDGYTRVNYSDVFYHETGLSSTNQKLLAHAQAYLSDNYLVGVAFRCNRAADSVTIINELLFGQDRPVGDIDKANAAAALRFNRLTGTELTALHCK